MAEDDKKEDDKKEGPGGKAGELFFKSRTVLVTGEINDKLASRVTTQLIALSEDSDDPINVFISSPGGHVESGDMVHDMIKFIRPTRQDQEWKRVRWHTELAVAAEEARRLQRPILLWTMNGNPCGET